MSVVSSSRSRPTVSNSGAYDDDFESSSASVSHRSSAASAISKSQHSASLRASTSRSTTSNRPDAIKRHISSSTDSPRSSSARLRASSSPNSRHAPSRSSHTGSGKRSSSSRLSAASSHYSRGTDRSTSVSERREVPVPGTPSVDDAKPVRVEDGITEEQKDDISKPAVGCALSSMEQESHRSYNTSTSKTSSKSLSLTASSSSRDSTRRSNDAVAVRAAESNSMMAASQSASSTGTRSGSRSLRVKKESRRSSPHGTTLRVSSQQRSAASTAHRRPPVPSAEVPASQEELDDMLAENENLRDQICSMHRSRFHASIKSNRSANTTSPRATAACHVQESLRLYREAEILRQERKSLLDHRKELNQLIRKHVRARRYTRLLEDAKKRVAELTEEKRDLSLEVRCNERLLVMNEDTMESGLGARRLHEDIRAQNALLARGLERAVQGLEESQRLRMEVQMRVESLEEQLRSVSSKSGTEEMYQTIVEVRSNNKAKQESVVRLQRRLQELRPATPSRPSQSAKIPVAPTRARGKSVGKRRPEMRVSNKSDEKTYLLERIACLNAELQRRRLSEHGVDESHMYHGGSADATSGAGNSNTTELMPAGEGPANSMGGWQGDSNTPAIQVRLGLLEEHEAALAQSASGSHHGMPRGPEDTTQADAPFHDKGGVPHESNLDAGVASWLGGEAAGQEGSKSHQHSLVDETHSVVNRSPSNVDGRHAGASVRNGAADGLLWLDDTEANTQQGKSASGGPSNVMEGNRSSVSGVSGDRASYQDELHGSDGRDNVTPGFLRSDGENNEEDVHKYHSQSNSVQESGEESYYSSESHEEDVEDEMDEVSSASVRSGDFLGTREARNTGAAVVEASDAGGDDEPDWLKF